MPEVNEVLFLDFVSPEAGLGRVSLSVFFLNLTCDIEESTMFGSWDSRNVRQEGQCISFAFIWDGAQALVIGSSLLLDSNDEVVAGSVWPSRSLVDEFMALKRYVSTFKRSSCPVLSESHSGDKGWRESGLWMY